MVLMACLFVGRKGDCEGRDRNLSVVIGFGLCVNGMNWPFWAVLPLSLLRREAEVSLSY